MATSHQTSRRRLQQNAPDGAGLDKHFLDARLPWWLGSKGFGVPEANVGSANWLKQTRHPGDVG